jgi:hypothetical protein
MRHTAAGARVSRLMGRGFVANKRAHLKGRIAENVVLINSTIAFSLALSLTITLHEFGHAFAALALGHHPIVHPFSVQTNVFGASQGVIAALAGPILSLGIGLLFLAISARRRGSGFTQLLLLWLGLFGVQEFFGYLITAPFVATGDIGSALKGLGTPGWPAWLCFAIGWVGTYFVGSVATRRLTLMTDPAQQLAPQLRRLGLFAWLLGFALATVLSIGAFDPSAMGLFELAGGFSLGISLIFVRLFMRRTVTGRAMPKYAVPWIGMICLVILAALRLIVLQLPGGLRL